MNDKNTDFPQYRKLSNGKTYYKITGERTFIEIQLMGSKKFRYTTEAKQYPEMLKIKDMLALHDHYLPATKEEFEELENN